MTAPVKGGRVALAKLKRLRISLVAGVSLCKCFMFKHVHALHHLRIYE